MSKPKKTLKAIFAAPTRANIPWDDIVTTLEHFGAVLSDGKGSVVRIALGDRVGILHKPHPANEAKKYQVEYVRELLEAAGVTP